jgi:hypothetical protein
VDTPLEYSEVVSEFPLAATPGLDSSPFPRQFPFSAMVPKVYKEVKDFILVRIFGQIYHMNVQRLFKANHLTFSLFLLRNVSSSPKTSI